MLAGGDTEEFGRAAYMAEYHAAMTFISNRTGKSPKTHRGLRAEFARFARDELRVSPGDKYRFRAGVMN